MGQNVSAETVTEAVLVEAARCAGFTVSRSQLKRLRREGLVQGAAQYHPVGRRGSETRYPAAAVDQLMGVLRIRRRRRPFDAVRFLAWEEGLWVDHRDLRATLARWVRASARSAQHLRRGEAADVTASRRAIRLDRSRTPMTPLSRELLGSTRPGRERQDVLFADIQLACGSPDLVLASELLERQTGFSATVAEWGVDTTLVEAVARLGLPPAAQWPRLVSRASRAQLAAGRTYLEGFRAVAEEVPIPGRALLIGDIDAAIRYRAGLAATFIILNRRTRGQTTSDP